MSDIRKFMNIVESKATKNDTKKSSSTSKFKAERLKGCRCQKKHGDNKNCHIHGVIDYSVKKVRLPKYEYGKVNPAYKLAKQWLSQHGTNGHEYFDSPDYAGMPKRITSKLSSDEVDFIQKHWPQENIQESIQVGDQFDIELDQDTLIETGVLEVTDDAIILEGNDELFDLLSKKGITLSEAQDWSKYDSPTFLDPERVSRLPPMQLNVPPHMRTAGMTGSEIRGMDIERQKSEPYRKGYEHGLKGMTRDGDILYKKLDDLTNYNKGYDLGIEQHLKQKESESNKSLDEAKNRDRTYDADRHAEKIHKRVTRPGNIDRIDTDKEIMRAYLAGRKGRNPYLFNSEIKSIPGYSYVDHANNSQKPNVLRIAKGLLAAYRAGKKSIGEKVEQVDEAKYQGRTVSLGKPFLTPDGPKKRSVYVKNAKGNVVKVNFGDKKMRIKKSNPKRRKSFRARHNCKNPGPRWKARYWSCRFW